MHKWRKKKEQSSTIQKNMFEITYIYDKTRRNDISYYKVQCVVEERCVSKWISLGQLSQHMQLVCQFDKRYKSCFKNNQYNTQMRSFIKNVIFDHRQVTRQIVYRYLDQNGILRQVNSSYFFMKDKVKLLYDYLSNHLTK